MKPKASLQHTFIQKGKKERKKEGKAANCDPAFLNRLRCCSQFVGRGCELTTVESRVSE